jgi:hypothetical protein
MQALPAARGGSVGFEIGSQPLYEDVRRFMTARFSDSKK